MHAYRYIPALCLSLVLGAVGIAASFSGPAAQLSEQIEGAFKLLNDPALQGAGHDSERRAALRQIAVETFDFTETARRVLGTHWTARTPDEQDRFVHAFVDLVDHAYLRRVDQFGNQRLVVGDQAIQADEATVKVNVVAKDGDSTAIDFLMVRTAGDRWRAYDVKIAGISLVSSYRSQFNKIIRSASYDELIKRLEAKTASRDGVASP